MASQEATFHARITADVSQFKAEVAAAAATLAALVKASERSGKVDTKAKGAGKKAAAEIDDVYAKAKRASADIHKQTMDQIATESTARSRVSAPRATHLGTKEGPGASAVNDVLNEIDAQNRLNKTLVNNAKVEAQAERMRQKALDARTKDHLTLSKQIDLGIQQEQASRKAASDQLIAQFKEQDRMNVLHNRALRENSRFNERMRANELRAQQRQLDAMVTGRYALYDLASTYDIAGRAAGTLALAMSSVVLISAKFETAFTSVERTLKPLPDEIDSIKQQLIDLSTSMPASFMDLSSVATLGAQMGITASGIEDFTKTISAFSAVTGTTIDEVAQKFGRIAGLANIPTEDFDKFGSAVIYAGNNAVATEQEILRLTEAIAANATQNGFAADQIIGLSTSLASLGIAPELARGVFTRVFGDINRAVETGGSKLDAFAKSLNMSGEAASALWKSDPEQFFNKMLTGLGTTKNFTKAMDALGFTETRETDVLRRLAENMDLVNKSMSDAEASYSSGTALADAYGKTADNLEAKMQMLINSFMALGDAAGQGLIGPMGALVDALKAGSIAMTEFLKTPLGNTVVPIITSVSALASIMLLFRGAAFRATAQLFAMRTAMIQMGRVGELTGGIRDLASTMMGLNRAVKDTDGSIKFLSRSQAEARGLLQAWTLGNTDAMYAVKGLDGAVVQLTRDQAINAGVVDRWDKAAANATRTTRMFSMAMAGIGMLGAAAAVVSLLGMFGEMERASMNIAESGGGLASLRDAIYADTKLYKETGEAISTFSGEITTSTATLTPWAKSLQAATGGQMNLSGEVSDVTKKVDEQTYAIGKNTAVWLANAVANDAAVQKIFKDMAAEGVNLADEFTNTGLSISKMTEAALKSPGKGAVSALSNAKGKLKPYFDQIIQSAKDSGLSIAMIADQSGGADDPVFRLAGQMMLLATNIDNAVNAGTGAVDIFKALGGIVPDTTEDFDSFNTTVKKTALEVMQELTTKVFRSTNALIDMRSAVRALAEGLSDSKDWSSFSDEGATNLQNLLGVIDAIVVKSNGNKKTAVSNLLALKAAMAQLGMSSVQSTKLIDMEIKALGVSGKATKAEIAGFVTALKNGAKAVPLKEFKTALDYASDLGGVLKRAFDLRYGKQTALDDIWSQWNKLKEEAQASRDAINEANRAMQDIQADKNILEYQLKIAIKYGDTLRADALRAKIGEANGKIAAEQKKVSEAQEDMDKSLTGNSKAAVKNRATVRGMVSSYTEYLGTLAASGMSAEDLNKEAKKLSAEFLAQGAALGFSTTELSTYTKAFEGDFATAIKNLPSNITLKLDSTDPIITAIAEFVGKANAELGKIKIVDLSGNVIGGDTGTGGSQTGNFGFKSETNPAYTTWLTARTPLVTTYNAAVRAWNAAKTAKKSSAVIEGLYKKVTAARAKITAWDSKKPAATVQVPIKAATGGYISGSGTATSDSIPAMLSNGEYVMRASAVSRYGVDFMNAINGMQASRPMPTGASASVGGGSQIIQLSPEDRSLLRQAIDRPVNLYADNAKIAQSANAGNQVLAKRGGN